MAGRLEYERRRNLILVWDDQGDTVIGPQVGSWYGGPASGDVFWPPLWNQLKEEIPDGCEDVDQASSRVISLGSSAGDEHIDTRGLVLGYVQSGKTTNFMSVIAKAADVGYKLIIVLSGQTDNLRQQTQDRIQHYLLGSHPTRIHPLTTLEKDFSEDILPEALLSQDDLRFLAVVKKNPARLSRLNKWLKRRQPPPSHPARSSSLTMRRTRHPSMLARSGNPLLTPSSGNCCLTQSPHTLLTRLRPSLIC